MNHWLFAATAATALAAPALAQTEPLLSERERVFMPEFELGAMAFPRDDLSLGFVARTSMEYRPDRLRAPFLRITYDATTASFVQPATETLPELRGPYAAHDILLGGGYRVGSQTVQGVFGFAGGLRLDALPRLIEDEALEISTRTRVGAAARLSMGVEVYVEEESAITLELLGQRMWGPIWSGSDAWAFGALVGFTSSL